MLQPIFPDPTQFSKDKIKNVVCLKKMCWMTIYNIYELTLIPEIASSVTAAPLALAVQCLRAARREELM